MNWLKRILHDIDAAGRRAALEDMHRMACSWAGRELPQPPVEISSPPPGPQPPGLKFSTKSRQRLEWMDFVCRTGH